MKTNTFSVAVLAALLVLLGALTHQRNLDYRSETSLWSSAVRVDPDNPRAWLGLGAAALREGRYRTARRSLEKTIALSSGQRNMRTEALNNLAVLEMKTGNRAQAVRYFRELLVLDRNDVHALYNLASLLLDSGLQGGTDPGEAEIRITRLEELLTPTHERVQVLRTAQAIRTGRYPEALRYLKLQGRDGLESALFQPLWAELSGTADDETFAAATAFLTSLGVSPGLFFLKMEQVLLGKNMVREAQSVRQRSSRR